MASVVAPAGRSTWAVASLLCAWILAACGNDGDVSGPGDPASTPSSGPTIATPTTDAVDVYYVVDTRTGLRLARESRDVDVDRTTHQAVETMITGALDPDYATTWDPDTEVLGVSESAGLVTIDLSPEARRANTGSAGAALMIQQLVYTVTATTDDEDRVLLLIDGLPAGELWGTVTWDEPVARADALEVRQLVQIHWPGEGTTQSSPVTVSGDAAVFEANLPWRVTDVDGVTIRSGNASTAEGQTFAPFSFDVALDPGTYVVEIREDDPSGGAAGEPMTDTRTVTVR